MLLISLDLDSRDEPWGETGSPCSAPNMEGSSSLCLGAGRFFCCGCRGGISPGKIVGGSTVGSLSDELLHITQCLFRIEVRLHEGVDVLCDHLTKLRREIFLTALLLIWPLLRSTSPSRIGNLSIGLYMWKVLKTP